MKNVGKPLREPLAGQPSRTNKQHSPKALVFNARDERTLAWLINQVGLEAVQEACEKIAGDRKPYPSNLAKVLGVSIPQSVIEAPASVARERIRELLIVLTSSRT